MNWPQYQIKYLAWVIGAGLPSAVLAQASEDPAAETISVIDEDPISSNRAAAMGGAIGSLSDNLDATFQNPAGIGGLDVPAGGNKSWFRKIYFPHVTAAGNTNARSFLSEMRSSGASTDSTAGKAVIDARAGIRDYGRTTAVGGAVLGRLMLIPYTDIQAASTPIGGGTEQLDLHYRTMSGIGYGFSMQDSKNTFSIGYFGYTANRKDVDGTFTYDELTTSEQRNEVLAPYTHQYEGQGSNFGVIWRLGKKGAPALGVSTKNAGGTRFKSKSGDETLTVKENIQTTMAISPEIGKTGALNFVIGMDQLMNNQVSATKKFHVGSELELGGRGSYATFSLRAGYNAAGPSGGILLNLGLIGFEATTYCIDISNTNAKVSERRLSGSMFINVADF